MTWRELLSDGENILNRAEIAEAALDAWYLLSYVSRMDRAQFFLHQTEQAPEERCHVYREILHRRAAHEPLQYLTGEQEFMGLSFLVSPDVLIPRQDTESLVEYLLPHVKGKRVLDVCTGSGCIAVALEKLGHPAQTAALDLSEKALALARKNAVRCGAAVTFYQSDMLREIHEKYDVIVSNPPYIDAQEMRQLQPEVRCHEPEMALYGGEDGLDFYRRLAAEALACLEEQGILAVEIGCCQREAVMSIFRKAGWMQTVCRQDLCGRDRIVIARRASGEDLS